MHVRLNKTLHQKPASVSVKYNVSDEENHLAQKDQVNDDKRNPRLVSIFKMSQSNFNKLEQQQKLMDGIYIINDDSNNDSKYVQVNNSNIVNLEKKNGRDKRFLVES